MNKQQWGVFLLGDIKLLKEDPDHWFVTIHDRLDASAFDLSKENVIDLARLVGVNNQRYHAIALAIKNTDDDRAVLDFIFDCYKGRFELPASDDYIVNLEQAIESHELPYTLAQLKIGSRKPDFSHTSAPRVIIFHPDKAAERVPPEAIEVVEKSYLSSYNYKCLIIWEKDLPKAHTKINAFEEETRQEEKNDLVS